MILNFDILKCVLLYCDVITIKEFSKINKNLSDKIQKDDHFWEQIVKRDYKHVTEKFGNTWILTYQKLNTNVYVAECISVFKYYKSFYKMFWNQEQAVSYCIKKIINSNFPTNGFEHLKLDKYSAEFIGVYEDNNNILAIPENFPTLMDEYKIFIEEYRGILRDMLLKGFIIHEGEFELKFRVVKKKIID